MSFGDFESYRDRFEKIQNYFAPRFPDAVRVGNEMIKTILEKTAVERHVTAPVGQGPKEHGSTEGPNGVKASL